jgi:hypothetical protein
MQLNVSREDAEKLLETIPHKSCKKAIVQHWRMKADGEVTAQGVFWLFCWAKTGMNKPEAAEVARDLFDRFFPVSFRDFDSHVPHHVARELRYAGGDVEAKLDALLAGKQVGHG